MSTYPADHESHCLTCGDVAVAMEVEEVHGEMSLCIDGEGARHEVAVDLVGPVAPGDRVLVHAGVAIA